MEKHEDNFLNEGEKLQASELLLPDYLEDDVSFEQRAYINTILKNEFIYNEAFYSIPLSLFNGNNQLPEKFVLSI
ncbi:hypothetical protein FACS1894166_08060 [Bacilli bacterium]|nr:hypothetical protein FACS1894166_08060 [Bacilli bacterium]